MGSMASGNNIVDQMGVLNISGNVIPQIWYKTITKTTGKPYLLAITLLADIVYWYRPKEVRDEASGQIVGWHKKFKGDLLQKTYQQYADLLGESKRSVKAALDRLEELSVIRKEFRDIEYENGLTMYNLMYIALNVDVLAKLTYSEKTWESAELQDFVPPPTKNCTTPLQKTGEGVTENCWGTYRNPEGDIQEMVGGDTENSSTSLQKNVSPHTEICKTNTYITTENTYRDIYPINQSYGNEKRAEIYKADNDMIDVMDDASAYMKIIRENIEYGYHMKYDSVQDRELFEELYGVICDVVCVRRKSVKVNGEDYPYELVKSKFLKLDSGHLEYVINSMKGIDSKITNIRAYMVTALYNAPDTINHYYQQMVQHDMYTGELGKKEILSQ